MARNSARKRPGVRQPKRRSLPRRARKGPSETGPIWDRVLELPGVQNRGDPGLVRLNAFMARCGVGSRRASDTMIEEGRVVVNGTRTTELGTRIDPLRDRVQVDGEPLKPEKPVYVLLNKPSGVVCTNSSREQKPRAIDLVTHIRARLFPVGRLDADSEGLLLLTNDGLFSDRLMHPRYGVRKTYAVTLRGRIEGSQLSKARGGVWLAEGKTSGFRIRLKKRGRERSYLEVTTSEGRNREIRRVFAKTGHPVLKLKRIRVGFLTLRGLGRGKYRFLRKSEVEKLVSDGGRA